MAAYALVEVTIRDQEKMGPYREQVEATIEAFGGRYLVRGGAVEVLEGSIGEHPIKVVLEFPSMERARAWYDSEAYQALLSIRTAAAKANFLLVEGV